MVLIIGLGTFASFGTSISTNDTNATNTTNSTNTTSKTSSLATLAAAPSSSSYTSLDITPGTLNLGSVLADNSETSYLSQTAVQVCAGDFVSFNSLKLYVQSTGNMNSG
ncbi:MAG: hypothetical protein K8E24_015985, partial [Methanobacterium paludis]|nr:hypothetical protein [Methanobacterium paludis]